MNDERAKTNNWPTTRIDPATLLRLKNVVNRPEEAKSLILLVNALLREALDQIESTAEAVPISPLVKKLRALAGRYSATEFTGDLETILSKQEAMDHRIQRLERMELESRGGGFSLNEEPPPRTTKKKT